MSHAALFKNPQTHEEEVLFAPKFGLMQRPIQTQICLILQYHHSRYVD